MAYSFHGFLHFIALMAWDYVLYFHVFRFVLSDKFLGTYSMTFHFPVSFKSLKNLQAFYVEYLIPKSSLDIIHDFIVSISFAGCYSSGTFKSAGT